MDHQADHHRHHVHAQLPGNNLQVSDRSDLPGDEGGDANRRIPEERNTRASITFIELNQNMIIKCILGQKFVII